MCSFSIANIFWFGGRNREQYCPRRSTWPSSSMRSAARHWSYPPNEPCAPNITFCGRPPHAVATGKKTWKYFSVYHMEFLSSFWFANESFRSASFSEQRIWVIWIWNLMWSRGVAWMWLMGRSDMCGKYSLNQDDFFWVFLWNITERGSLTNVGRFDVIRSGERVWKICLRIHMNYLRRRGFSTWMSGR